MASRPQQRGVGAFFQAMQPAGVEDLEGAQLIDIARLAPNPFQPRKEFDGDRLRELTLSIKQVGVLQPLLVRQTPDDEESYQIAAGERRYRAGQLAGLLALPCTVRDLDDDAMETLALLENIQREDLNPIDEAEAYKRLMNRRGFSLRDMAAYIHKSHEHVAQRLRLLDSQDIVAIVRAGLPPSVALSIDRCAEPDRSAFIARALDGDPPSLSEVRAARTAQDHASLSKVLTAGTQLEASNIPSKVSGQSDTDNAILSKLLTAETADDPIQGIAMTAVTAMPTEEPKRLPVSKVLTPGMMRDSETPDRGTGTQSLDQFSCWVQAEDTQTGTLFHVGNGRAEREQLRAALWADLEALDG